MLDAVRVSQIQSISFAPGDLRQHSTNSNGGTDGLGSEWTPSVVNTTTEGSHPNYDDLDGPLPLALRQQDQHHNISGDGGATLSQPPRRASDAISLTASSETTSHPNFFSDDALAGGGGGHPMEVVATGAFSPLSSSERVASGHASPDDGATTRQGSRTTMTINLPALGQQGGGGRRGSGQTHVSIGDPPSSTLDVSLGPATTPVYSAFCSDELIISKFAVLLAGVVQLARVSSGPASESNHRGSSRSSSSTSSSRFSESQFLRTTFLPASRGSVFACVSAMDVFRRWVDATESAAAAGGAVGRQVVLGDGSTTIVVHVTPRGGLVGAEDQSLASSSSASNNNNSANPNLKTKSPQSLDAQVQAFLAATPLPKFVEALARECMMDFPRLVHILVDASPYRRAQNDFTQHILGNKRRSSVAANQLTRSSPMPASLNLPPGAAGSSTHVPPLALWQPASAAQQRNLQSSANGAAEERALKQQTLHNHQLELSTFLGAEPPKFIGVRTIAEAYLNLYEKSTLGLLCRHSSESNARCGIALDHVLERWNSAMDFLCRPALTALNNTDAKYSGNLNNPANKAGVVAKASRAVGGSPPPVMMAASNNTQTSAAAAAAAASAMTATVADELVQLALELSKIASSSTPLPAPGGPTDVEGRRQSTQSLGSQELVYSFDVTMSDDLDRSWSRPFGDGLWNFSTDGSTGGSSSRSSPNVPGADSSLRYHNATAPQLQGGMLPPPPGAGRRNSGGQEMEIVVVTAPPPSPLRRRGAGGTMNGSPKLRNSIDALAPTSTGSTSGDEGASSLSLLWRQSATVHQVFAPLLAVTIAFLLGSVIGLSASGEAASSSVAAGLIVVSIALVVASCVSCWRIYAHHQRCYRLSLIERDLTAALAVVASAMTQPTNAPTEISAGSGAGALTNSHHQPHHAHQGAHHPTPASAMSTMGTATLAISTPSPFPTTNNNSATSMLMLDAQRSGSNNMQHNGSAFVVLGGNQTPLGFFGGGGDFGSKPSPPLQMTGGPSSFAGGSGSTSNILLPNNNSKKPNPLTTDALMTTGAFGDDDASGAGDGDEDADVIRVRMDPTGTFLIPFMEKEPILLDGVYVHQHLAVLGIEFTRLLNEDSTFGAIRSASGTRRGGDTTNGDSLMFGDDVQDEDRYSVCMWNLAMSEASGGYSAAQVVDQTLAQVVADNDSYDELIQRIVQCEQQFDAAGSTEQDTISTETFVLKVVHKEHGSRALRMSLSPVIRWENGAPGGEASSFSFGGPRLVCIGVLLVGVPVDAQGQVQAFNFRNLFLSEVAEECVAASALVGAQLAALAPANVVRQHLPSMIWGAVPSFSGDAGAAGGVVGGKVPNRSPILASSFNVVAASSLPPPLAIDNNRASFIAAVLGTVSPTNGQRQTSAAFLATVASPSTTSLTDPSPHHAAHALVGKLRDYKRVNDYFMWKALQDLSTVASFEDQPWKPVYTNFIPGMLAKSFPKYHLRVKVEPTVPSIVDANIVGLTAVIDNILNTVPPKATPTQAYLMNASLKSASLGATQTPLAAGGGGAVAAAAVTSASSAHAAAVAAAEAANIRITFGVLPDSSVSMFCKIEHLGIDRFVDALVREIELEEQTNTAPPSGSFLYFIRAAQGKLMIIGGGSADDATAMKGFSTPGKEVPDVPNGFMPSSKQTSSAQDLAETSLRSADETPTAPPVLPPRPLHVSPSFSLGKDTLVIVFPFRMHTGANGAVSAWETRANKSSGNASSQIGSIESSQRDTLMNISSPSLGVVGGGGGVSADAFILTVMVDVHNELDRQKYIRRFWEDHHSVFPIDPNKFLSRGVKLLRSQCRTFDAVVLDIPMNVNDSEFEKKMEDIAREFPDTVFVLLRSKAKKKRHSIIQQRAGPPLAPKPSVTAMEKQSSMLFSFVPTPQPKPENMHVIPKAHTQQGINELLTYVVNRVTLARDSIKRKQHIKDLFKQHRTSPWTKGKKLGRGTFGDVYEANFALTGGRMAVKIIRLPSNDPNRMEQLINEVEILVKVQHPNIVQYFYCEAGAVSGEVNIFMELCTGGSLQGKCNTLRSLDLGVISTWTQQLCSSLAYLHLNHLAHRDIKPANVLLSETGIVKLADFGTATAVSMPLNEVAGTFAYMAPEVYAGSDYGTPCDVWSVGCVILDLLGKETLQNLVGSTSGGLGGGYFHECDSDDIIWQRLEQHVHEPLLLDFLRGCFRLDPLQRCTAEQLLLHPFLTRTQQHQHQLPAAQGSPVGGLQKKRSSPNLARKSHESSVGALSVDSGEFNRRSASGSAFGGRGSDDNNHVNNDEDEDDDSSDDGWGDLVRVADEESDRESGGFHPQPSPSPILSSGSRKPAYLTMGSASGSSPSSSNCFTPKFHNGPSPVSRGKAIAESPAASRRHKSNTSGKLLGEDSAGGVSFSTGAAALARRQSTLQAHSAGDTSSSGGITSPPSVVPEAK